jgi:hypothetical protein
MIWCKIEDVTKTLDEALLDKVCVQVWLGIGQALFIGFGDHIIPAIMQGDHHPKPPYELETGSTDWWIQDKNGIVATSNSARKDAETAAQVLVGKKVIGWYFYNGSAALCIDFECGLELKMAPYSNSDVFEEDAWILRGSTHYGFMRWDCVIGNGRLDHYFVDEPG